MNKISASATKLFPELRPIHAKWSAALRAYQKQIDLIHGGEKDYSGGSRARYKLEKLLWEASGHAPTGSAALTALQGEFDALPKMSEAAEIGRIARKTAWEEERKRLIEDERDAAARSPTRWMSK